MEKKVSVLVSMLLVGLLFIGAPLQATSMGEDDFEASNSRTVSVTEYYDASQYVVPPSTTYYNSGGYSGTLYLDTWQSQEITY
ncbi:hypothetical protein [Alkalibacillus haloalkaliphilus]|uniref:hypothetical protein n=1 Tax=Alkalibacillus haloalkaliphilus TaxID=94136 RepID=UPI0002F3D858|nr:hypothetical protein [Alkalibacillus haloalkaliphilus]